MKAMTHLSARTLQPELLDALPPESAEAAHSRRDLVYFNRVMGTHRWFRRELPRLVSPGDRVLELGAGSGRLAGEFIPLGLKWDAIDLAPPPSSWPGGHRWYSMDVRQFTDWANYPVVVVNLFFHHLSDHDLSTLGAHLDRHARQLLVCEPTRERRWQWAFRAVCTLVRANHVSRHDGQVSIEAGFRDDELPRLLRLDPRRWKTTVGISSRGVYRMLASRLEP